MAYLIKGSDLQKVHCAIAERIMCWILVIGIIYHAYIIIIVYYNKEHVETLCKVDAYSS